MTAIETRKGKGVVSEDSQRVYKNMFATVVKDTRLSSDYNRIICCSTKPFKRHDKVWIMKYLDDRPLETFSLFFICGRKK